VSHGLTSFLTVAYAVMGFVALLGYLPQMWAFWRKPEVCAHAPLVTWGLWAAQTVVFFAYAVIVNGDAMFMMTTGMFMVATWCCLLLIVRGRRLNTPRKPADSGGTVVPFAPGPSPKAA